MNCALVARCCFWFFKIRESQHRVSSLDLFEVSRRCWCNSGLWHERVVPDFFLAFLFFCGFHLWLNFLPGLRSPDLLADCGRCFQRGRDETVLRDSAHMNLSNFHELPIPQFKQNRGGPGLFPEFCHLVVFVQGLYGVHEDIASLGLQWVLMCCSSPSPGSLSRVLDTQED